jgi:glycosyltransferase involved in cell wall biosynthesis
MRILLIHGFYQQFGGEDAVALSEKAQLERHGHEVIFYQRHNSEISSYSLTDMALLPLRSLYSSRTTREIREVVTKRRPEVAYIHNFFPLLSPSLYDVLDDLAVPTVQALHDFRFLCPNGWFYTEQNICERCKHGNYIHAVRHRCYRNSRAESTVAAAVSTICRVSGVLRKINAFIASTDFIRNQFVTVGVPPERIFVRPHSIDSSITIPTFTAGEYVLFLGRLSEEKGLWPLVRSFEQCRNMKLCIVGTGPLEHELRAYVTANRLTNIEMVGFKTGEQKWDYVRRCAFVVVPSQCYETFSLVVLESYVAGKPVIASALGSLPYVVEDGKSGLLFEPGNSADLSAKIKTLWGDPAAQRSMGTYARSLAEQKYGAARNYQSLMTIFSQVVGSRASL